MCSNHSCSPLDYFGIVLQPTEHSTEISLPARRHSLPELLTWVHTRAALLGLPAADTQRLQLVVEELFANTLEHGFTGESPTPVTVALASSTTGIHLRYCDQAPPFDPTAATPLPPDRDRLGGFGLNLVRSLAGTLHYRRQANCNILALDFPLPSAR